MRVGSGRETPSRQSMRKRAVPALQTAESRPWLAPGRLRMARVSESEMDFTKSYPPRATTCCISRRAACHGCTRSRGARCVFRIDRAIIRYAAPGDDSSSPGSWGALRTGFLQQEPFRPHCLAHVGSRVASMPDGADINTSSSPAITSAARTGLPERAYARVATCTDVRLRLRATNLRRVADALK